jgi:acetyltransferase-like isoleucine patch superfamily enzyme
VSADRRTVRPSRAPARRFRRTRRPQRDVVLDHPSGRRELPPTVLGADACLRSGTVIYAGSVIGGRFSTGHNVVVREECRIGDDVSIWSNTVIDYGVEVGDGVKIHANCYVAQFSRIGAGAFLAPGVTLANDLYPGNAASGAVMAGPTIEPGAQIGVNTSVLPYVTIGAGAVIGAGSVVTRNIPAGYLAYGAPAAVIRPLDDVATLAARVRDRASRSGR